MLGQPQPEDPRPQGNRTTSSHAESVGQPATVEPHLRRAILLHQHLGSRTARLWVNNAFGVVLGSPGRDEDTSSGAGASYFVPAVAGLRRTCRPSTQAAWSTETPAPPPASSLQPPASSLQPPASFVPAIAGLRRTGHPPGQAATTGNYPRTSRRIATAWSISSFRVLNGGRNRRTCDCAGMPMSPASRSLETSRIDGVFGLSAWPVFSL